MAQAMKARTKKAKRSNTDPQPSRTRRQTTERDADCASKLASGVADASMQTEWRLPECAEAAFQTEWRLPETADALTQAEPEGTDAELQTSGTAGSDAGMQATWRGVDAGFQTERGGCSNASLQTDFRGKHIALQTEPEPRKRMKAALAQTPTATAADGSVQTSSCSVKEASIQTAKPKGTLKEKKTQTDTCAARVAEVQTDGDFSARLQDLEAAQARHRELEEGRDAALASTAATEAEPE